MTLLAKEEVLSTNLYPTLTCDQSIVEQAHRLESSGGLQLHLHSWRTAGPINKVLVIVHGLGGHGAYYARSLAPWLAPAGVAIYAPDLRGHGLSEGARGHIDTFEHFQADVAAAVRWARAQHPGLPVFLLGESMGTSIAITYAATAPADARPDFLALIACVVAPSVMPRPQEVVRTLYYLMRDRNRIVIPITGREEQGVRDAEFIQVLKTDELFNRKISVCFLSQMTFFMGRAAKMHAQLKLPVFLAQGGGDITVSHRRTRAFFKRIAAPDKELHYFPQAFHALLNDPDAPIVRERLLGWMERHRRQFEKSNSK